MKEVAEELRNEHAEPGADNAADQDTERYDRENKLDIVGDDCAIGVSDSLQQSNLLSLKRNKACQRQIDQERRYQQEDRRQRAAHVAEHVEFVINPGVRGLILPPVGSATAILIEEGVEPHDGFTLGCTS